MFRRLQGRRHQRLLALDIDRTIVYTIRNGSTQETSFLRSAEHLQMFADRKCYLRHFLGLFLQNITQSFDVALVSCADPKYVDKIVELLASLVSPCFLFAGKKRSMQKSLFQASHGYQHIIAIDDKPELWIDEKQKLGERS